MPLYAIHCLDKPGAGELRAATRPEHLAYLEGAEPRIVAGGALLDLEGQPMGSLIILRCDERREAYDFAASDPYSLAGLFQSVAITEWRQAFPRKSKDQPGTEA